MYKHVRFVPEAPVQSEPMVGELRLTDYLVEHPAVSMFHHMRGASMRDFGILDGDQLIIERGRMSQPGDVVLAIVDDNFIVRQYQLHHGKPYLQSGNSDYGSIMPAEELQIAGVVVGIVRKYH